MNEKDVGTIKDAIQYFNQHPFLFEKEENEKGHMERVMAILTQENMETLEKQFQLYSKGLELPTFIYLIKKLYIPDHEYSKYFFVSDLIKFFQAIDINGDGHLEWSQFTEYIIENIRVVEKPRYKNRDFEENQIISSAYSKVSSEYRITKTFDISTQSVIKKIIYMEEGKTYFVQESQSSCIKMYDHNFKLQDQISLEGKSLKSYIFDFSLNKDNVILGCIFEDSFYFCNLKVKSAVKAINKIEAADLKDCNKIEYLNKNKNWAALSKSGNVILFEVTYNSRTIIQFNLLKCIPQHESMITSIIEIDQPKCICTCSMDGQIKLYSKFLEKNYVFEHIGEQTTSIINDRMRKGIIGISYTNQFGNYLLAYTFSSEVYVYCLDISITKGYVGKYGEHTGTIKWAKFLKGFPYIVSFDEKLNMRIWDFRKFQTIQFINCEKNFINPSFLETFPELNQIMIGEKKITQFLAPALDKKSKEINEFHNIFDFRYCPHTNNIFIFTSNDVRVYNYFTGTLKKLFTKLYQSNFQTNITACEFGFKCKRFFVGDAGGFVREFCSETGECLQDINPSDELNYENKQIVAIIFLKDFSLLICCSIDGRLMIYERDENGEYVIIRDIRECHEELICATASSRYCLLATGGDDGTINVWNLQKYSLEGICVVSGKPIGIAFSPIHPLMLVACSDGYINLVYVRPYDGKNRYKCFTKIAIGRSSLEKITSFSFQLMINAYFPQKSHLNKQVAGNHHLMVCVGTQSGRIYVINLNQILSKYSVEENHQIFIIKSYQRCEIQVMRGIIINERNRVLLHGESNKKCPQHVFDEFPHICINTEEGPIENVLLSKENSAIFSKSTDKKLKVWSFSSECNGAINFSTFKKVFWKIPEVNFHKRLQSIETTVYSIKLIENKKFDAFEEQRIKVHLLLNEYLSTKEKQNYFIWLKESRNALKGNEEKDMSQQCLKNKKNERNRSHMDEQISEQQFNQIYTKLVTSIQKSLKQYNNSDKIFWEDREEGEKTAKPHTEEQSEVGNDHSREKKNGRRKTVVSSQIPKGVASSQKYDARLELFGKKEDVQKKKDKPKRNNMLFTSLSAARKAIQSHGPKKKALR